MQAKNHCFFYGIVERLFSQVNIRSDFLTSEAFRNNPLFLRNQFEGEGTFQIPIVKKQHISLEQLKFIGYDHIKSDERENKDSVVHFFLDDYKFEVLWNHPEPR